MSILGRLISGAARVRRSHTRTALLAVATAAAVATCLLNLYTDVQKKLRSEFRGYGANLVVIAKSNRGLPPDALHRVDRIIGPAGMAAPFSYVIASATNGDPVVVVGTDFGRVQKLNRWWAATGWPQTPGQALVGIRAAAALSAQERRPFELAYGARPLRLQAAGALKTGSGEDSRVYVTLDELRRWTGEPLQSIEVAVTGTTEEILQTRVRIAREFPDAEVRPIRQIIEAEARVLGKTRSALLASVAVIVVTVALCVLSTLIASALDRRKETALMRALGAGQRLVGSIFAAEAAVLGAAGALLGFPIGVGMAMWIGRANFHASVVPRWELLPVVLGGCIAIALISAALPIALLHRVQPAVLLKGE